MSSPDSITVTLTREEAEIVASDIDSGQVLAIGYQVAAAYRAKAKLRAALDSEARSITEEMVEAGARAIWRSMPNGATWATATRYLKGEAELIRKSARACLEAALKEDE